MELVRNLILQRYRLLAKIGVGYQTWSSHWGSEASLSISGNCSRAAPLPLLVETARFSMCTLGTQEISKTLHYPALALVASVPPQCVMMGVAVPQGMRKVCWFLPWFSSSLFPQLHWSGHTWLCAASPSKPEGQKGRATNGKGHGRPVTLCRLGWHSMELITQQ